MPVTPPKAIIFDIGRVLVGIDVSAAMGGFAQRISMTPQEIWSALEKDPRWVDWQEGRMSAHDWYLHAAKRLGVTLTFQQFTEIWNRALNPKPIQDNAFLEKISKRYRLGLLSNTDPIHVTHLESTYDFFRFFPARTYSCTVGASKPNPVIYQKALQASKVRAEEALYIDDIPAYVEAAQRLGMSGIVFQSPEHLQSAMLELGMNLG
jgi:HAD superfamily hydrolase (TIGR01509 family)